MTACSRRLVRRFSLLTAGLLTTVALFGQTAPHRTAAQDLLPGYDGYWSDRQRIEEFTVLALRELPAERWPLIRNELFARYGRAFRTPAYQEYFGAQPWYQVRPDYNDSWVPQRELAIAGQIRGVERPALTPEQMRARTQNRAEYTGLDAALSFIGPDAVIWADSTVDLADSGGPHGDRPQLQSWSILGDWIFIDFALGIPATTDTGFAVAYRLDHTTGRIVERQSAAIPAALISGDRQARRAQYELVTTIGLGFGEDRIPYLPHAQPSPGAFHVIEADRVFMMPDNHGAALRYYSFDGQLVSAKRNLSRSPGTLSIKERFVIADPVIIGTNDFGTMFQNFETEDVLTWSSRDITGFHVSIGNLFYFFMEDGRINARDTSGAEIGHERALEHLIALHNNADVSAYPNEIQTALNELAASGEFLIVGDLPYGGANGEYTQLSGTDTERFIEIFTDTAYHTPDRVILPERYPAGDFIHQDRDGNRYYETRWWRNRQVYGHILVRDRYGTVLDVFAYPDPLKVTDALYHVDVGESGNVYFMIVSPDAARFYRVERTW